ncbi:hypothetical protein Tco_1509374 [Tanacetum coccineum]
MGVAIATGRRGYYKPGTRAWVSRISRKIRIPISMYPCRVEERLTIELAKGREVEKIVTTETKNGVVTRYPAKFHEYQLTDKEKEIERMMIYWKQVEYEVSNEDDSNLKSTARSVPKDYEMVRTRHNNDDDNGQPNLAALIAEQLQNIIPQIVTQVTTNVNNANGGNGGNNGCSYKGFQACGPKEYDGKGVRGRDAANGMSWNDFKALLVEELCPSNEMEKLELELWNHKMGDVKVNQPITIQNVGVRRGLYLHIVAISVERDKSSEKRKANDEGAKSGGSWKDKKKAKVGAGFVATAPPE